MFDVIGLAISDVGHGCAPSCGDNSDGGSSEVVVTELISSEPPPNSSVQDLDQLPTHSNISDEMANDLCRGSLLTTELYDTCLIYAALETDHYVRTCVDDIKVGDGI